MDAEDRRLSPAAPPVKPWQRLVLPSLAAILVCATILCLPPGPARRLSAAIRYVTEPVLAWTNCATRVANAFVDHTPRQSQEEAQTATAEKLLELQALKTTNILLKNELQKLKAPQSDAYRTLYVTALAKVSKRDPLNAYYDKLVINRGSVDGIKPGQYVVALPQANPPPALPSLLGVVHEVSTHSASVTLITSEHFAVPCLVPARDVSGILIGAAATPYDGPAIGRDVSRLLLANPMGQDFNQIQSEDIVCTSALGDDPHAVPNLIVGTVIATSLSESGMPTVLVKPEASLWNITHVLVILGQN